MNQKAYLRSWWKDNWPVLVVAALMVVIAIITGLGYWLRLPWTGLVGISEHPTTRLGWDWLELLIIPIVLGAGAFWFNTQTRRSEHDLAQDRAREDSLQRYLDRMQELILDKGLKRSEEGAEERHVARARTVTVLRSLDGDRKGQLLRFLYEAGLIGRGVGDEPRIKPIINLATADLTDAVLTGAVLSGSDLTGADLRLADLTNSDLKGADLRVTYLGSAHLAGANLDHTILSNANLNCVDLSNTILTNANLYEAHLTRAKGWTNQQLAQAESLVGAILPDGMVMTEKAWQEFKKRYRQ